jgi:enamine deaminase RidA (YjgF/YER057c/UK114 family)
VSYDIVNPRSLGEPRGWNNGMLAPAGGRILFVAGQVGTEPGRGVVSGGMAAQWERALENVLAVVRAAGGDAADIGRMTIYVTDRQGYLDARKPLGEVWRRLMGGHYPALAVVEVKGLVDEGAVVEIEATAVLHA